METGVIKINGTLSQQDADHILQALHEVWGVQRANVNIEKGEAHFSFDKNAASYEDFQQAITDSGFDINI